MKKLLIKFVSSIIVLAVFRFALAVKAEKVIKTVRRVPVITVRKAV